MSETDIISIAFRLINFGVLIWIGYKIFKRYILPQIRNQMHERAVAIDQLHAMHHLLVKNIRDAERLLVDERSEQERLKEKVDQWRIKAAEMRAVIDGERIERNIQTRKRLAQQMRQIQMARIFSQAFPSALEQARAQLQEKFSNTQAQEKYLQRVTTRLRGE